MTTQDITFRDDGRTWKIEFTAHNTSGAVLPLSSGIEVGCQIAGLSGMLLDLTETSGGVAIIDEDGGRADMLIFPTDRTAAGIVAGDDPYWYQIWVADGEDRDIQAEGRLIVKVSQFTSGAIADPLLLQFRLRFTEFTEDDLILSMYLADATRIVDELDIFTSDERGVAIVHLAAHFLQMRKAGGQQYATGGVGADQIQSIRVADEAVTFMNPNAGISQLSKFALSQTAYGQRYLSMVRSKPRWKLRA